MATLRLRGRMTAEQARQIRAGDEVLLSGLIYTARDAAHKRMLADLAEGNPLPFDLVGAVIYYVGPTLATPDRVIGSAGPTSSYRMDEYTPELLKRGVRAVIGKGYRSREVRDALVRYGAVYLAATGGAGALLSQRIEDAEIVAYEDLGPEAVRRLIVKDFPTVCIHDAYGGDLYAEGQRRWAKPDAMMRPGFGEDEPA